MEASQATAPVALPPAAARSRSRQLVSDYVELTKPKVQSLLLLTTGGTMEIAGDPSVGLIAVTVLGGYLSAGGAGAVNHAFDRDIDALMPRTANRPVPRGDHLRRRPVAAVLRPADGRRQRARGLAGLRRLPRLRLRLHDVAQAHDA